MENFPIANSFLRKSYIRNDKVSTLLTKLEEALKKNQQVRKQLEDIQPELQGLQFQSNICDQVINVALEAQSTAVMASESVENCHKQIENLGRLINELEIGNILNYTVKCKEDETLRELTLMQKKFDDESKDLDLLDGRPMVKNIREVLIEKESSENELAVLELEEDNVERQMQRALKNATENRNKKIIRILENRKLILANEAKSTDQSCQDSEQDKENPSMPSKGWSNSSILLPALDFISKFMLTKAKDNEKPEQKRDVTEGGGSEQQEMALQSILHRRDGTPSPTKQVRFVASPHLESVHIVNRFSSMSTDDGSVGGANTESNSGSGSKQMVGPIEEMEECEDWKDMDSEVEYGDEEIDETKYLSAEEDEIVQMESDGEESGAVEAGKKKSTQVKKLPHKEGAGIEGNVKESLEKKSNNKNKAEVLDVEVMPPPDLYKRLLLQEKLREAYLRFGQQTSGAAAMDVDKQDEFKIWSPKRLDEEENPTTDDDIFELPMAQPKEFKHPDPKAGSPPSSDPADSMLNFSEPNCEFNDEFWLSNNDNDDNPTADPFYNL